MSMIGNNTGSLPDLTSIHFPMFGNQHSDTANGDQTIQDNQVNQGIQQGNQYGDATVRLHHQHY